MFAWWITQESEKHFYTNKLTGVTQWQPPKISRRKETGIPQWLRAESKGVADNHIAKITANAAAGPPQNNDDTRVDTVHHNSPRGKKSNSNGKAQSEPTAAGTTAAGIDGFVSGSLNWYGVFQKHGRMSIGAPK